MRASEVKRIRLSMGLSYNAMGAFLQVTGGTIQRWENPNNPRPRGLAVSMLAAADWAAKKRGPSAAAQAISLAPASIEQSLLSVLNLAYGPSE